MEVCHRSPIQREMEMEKRRILDREFNNATEEQQKRYHQLLNASRRNRMDPDKPGPVTISIEERLRFLHLAKSEEDISALVKPLEGSSVDPIKMRKDYESATIRNGGRPPIGGAQD